VRGLRLSVTVGSLPVVRVGGVGGGSGAALGARRAGETKLRLAARWSRVTWSGGAIEQLTVGRLGDAEIEKILTSSADMKTGFSSYPLQEQCGGRHEHQKANTRFQGHKCTQRRNFFGNEKTATLVVERCVALSG